MKERIIRNEGIKVAVVGATGAVGQEMVKTLEKRRFPVSELIPLASSRSNGKKIEFNAKDWEVQDLAEFDFSQTDLALFSAGGSVSKEFCPKAEEAGCLVVDNSSAFRMDDDIALIVPEINSSELSYRKRDIIANPNCSTIQMLLPLKALHEAFGLERVVVSTYQSVSGAGARAMEELKLQSLAWLREGKATPPEIFPFPIAFNCLPQIDVFLPDGFTKEERKMVEETQKILSLPDLPVTATTVRVPVFRSHAESVWIETKEIIDAEKAKKAITAMDGVLVEDDPELGLYPTPRQAEGQGMTLVGRIRKDLFSDRALAFWVVADNLLKGAALNAIQIAEAVYKIK